MNTDIISTEERDAGVMRLYETPPIENAGLYKGLASLKDSITAYRQATDELERERLFESTEQCSRELNLSSPCQAIPP